MVSPGQVVEVFVGGHAPRPGLVCRVDPRDAARPVIDVTVVLEVRDRAGRYQVSTLGNVAPFGPSEPGDNPHAWYSPAVAASTLEAAPLPYPFG
jgi:ABC-type Zn uptake system ZnuABC Zn-binding protein ZnuA